MNTIHTYIFTFAFSLLVACFFASVISAIALFFTHRRINAVMKHPYLEKQAFHQYPFSLQAAILLDYFWRISFPRSSFFLTGHANKLLKNIDPRELPISIKWPIVGFWGGCFVGILAMIVVWISMFLAR